ncbi:MAG: phosphatase PAP2 family protein [Pseudomonadota bacterium]|nr:phosphatase PAP2 family protein [Pseudomonadota bacterium]MDP1903462.1 phosphatase PAP2 family protein [Pseudomonadota bacterium]MDP2351581.1 phosphatase PAP2 family protein [Pseudomonadota bacterium]
MKTRQPITLWLLPAIALLVLLPLSDPARNQAAFLALNHAAAALPAVLWSNLTVLGDALVALTLSLLLLRRRPDLALAVLLASLPATLLTHGLKDALDVARPYAVLGDQAHVIGRVLVAGAFPSGHTTTIFVLAAVLVGGLRGTSATGWILAAALLAGFSRVAVGAHWPLDVIGGILCGWASGLLGLYWARRLDWATLPRVVLGMRLLLLGCAGALLFDYNSGYPLARPFELLVAVTVLAFHLLPGWRLEKPA